MAAARSAIVSTIRLAAVYLCLGAATIHAEEQTTIADGVYTERQAAAGEVLYEVQCLICHDKRYFRPVLKRWEGQPLRMLFTIMSTSMPQSNPGALPLADYVDILAYILSLSRYPAGDTELTHENGALDEIEVAPRRR